jgi:hypothetical protein
MAKLTYSAITSLDGFVADENGNLDWAEPDEEVFTFVTSSSARRHVPLRTQRTMLEGVRMSLQLRDERRYRSGVVYIHNGVKT